MPDLVISRNVSPIGFAATSERWERIGGVRCLVRNDDGDHHAYELPDGSIVGKCLVTPSPARAAADAPRQASVQTRDANTARIVELGMRAARYARDPVANAANQLNARLQHELLARLALQESSDDA